MVPWNCQNYACAYDGTLRKYPRKQLIVRKGKIVFNCVVSFSYILHYVWCHDLNANLDP